MRRTTEVLTEFLDPGDLSDGELSLVLREKRKGDGAWSPAYRFEMHLVESRRRVGGIDLRLGNSELLTQYGGHIGYGVDEAHRGHRFAARAVRLLLPLAWRHRIEPVWITCDPDNWASRRTCELAGGTLADIVDVPRHTEMYAEGERQKCRYRFLREDPPDAHDGGWT